MPLPALSLKYSTTTSWNKNCCKKFGSFKKKNYLCTIYLEKTNNYNEKVNTMTL